MTESENPQGQPYADGVPPDDPSVNHDAPPDGAGEATSTPPDQATTTATPPPAETEPAAETDDAAAGIEPGETQSVPTTRGPGPDDGEDGAAQDQGQG